MSKLTLRMLFMGALTFAFTLSWATTPLPDITDANIRGTTWEAVLWNPENRLAVRMEVESPSSGHILIAFGPEDDNMWNFRITRAEVLEGGKIRIVGKSKSSGTIELEGSGNGHHGIGVLVLEGEVKNSTLSFHEDNRLVFYGSISGSQIARLAATGRRLESDLKKVHGGGSKASKE